MNFLLILSFVIFSLILNHAQNQEIKYVDESSSDEGDEVNEEKLICELRTCTNWNITIISLLKINFEKFQIIEDIVNTILEDCRWKNYTINVNFLTKDLTFHKIPNPMLPIELTTEIRLLSLYTVDDRIDAYKTTTIFASDNMDGGNQSTGNYILVLTNMEDIIRDEVVLNYVDNELKKKKIHLRVIKIILDIGKKSSSTKIHHPHVWYKLLTRSKDNLGRVSLIETYDILDIVKPCPSLTNLQKIHQYGELLKERQIQWALDHINDFIIGGLIVFLAIMAGFLAAIYDIWNRKKSHKLLKS